MQLATKLDAEVFNRQNDLRQFPASFIPRLEERIPLFNGQTYSPIDGQPSAETIEGAAAAEDAIADLRLRSGSMLNKLEWSPGLALAARDHCADAGKLGLVGPLGSKGQTPATRVALYGDAGSALGENLAYGGTQSGFEITMQLLIDDGVTQRTSRRLLFDPRWNYTGIATCAHSTRTMMTSIVYSANDFRFNEYGLAKLAENPKATQMPAPPQIPMVGGFNRDVVSNIFALQNEIRVQPKNFLDELRARPGTAAVLEAVEAIENWNQTLSPLAWNNGLFLAARDHCDDLGPKQLIGPFGTNKSSPYDRISRYGHTDFWRAENRALTSDVVGDSPEGTAREIVLDLFIDALHGGRPQRQNLLNPNFRESGIYTCGHGLQRFTVIDYSGKMEVKTSAQATIAALKSKYHPAIEAEEPKPERCSALPDSVVTDRDCEFARKCNEVRTNPAAMVKALDEYLLSPTLVGEARYKVVKARRAIHRQRAGLKNISWSDSLFLAARDHCADGTVNGIIGDVGSDGTFPEARVSKYGKVLGLEEVVEAAQPLEKLDDAVMRAVVNGDLSFLFNPHAKFGAIATCAHKTMGGFTVAVNAEAVVPNAFAKKEINDIIKASKIIQGTAGPERALIQLSEDLAFWSGKQRAAIQNGESAETLDELRWRIDSIVALMRAERQKIESAKAAAVAKKMAAEERAINIANLEKKIKVEEAVLKQAADILARLEKGLDRYIRQPSGQTEQALNLYTDNIRAFVQAKAKAAEEMNKVQARVDALKAQLLALTAPEVVAAPAVVAVAPFRPPTVVAPAAPIEDDGFGEVVPTDLRDLVDERAAPLPSRSPFESGAGVIPAGLEDLVGDASLVAPMKEEPFESLLPTDAKDLFGASIAPGMADIDDGEFEALKNEAGLGDVDEGRRLSAFSIEDSLTTLMFGDHNLAL